MFYMYADYTQGGWDGNAELEITESSCQGLPLHCHEVDLASRTKSVILDHYAEIPETDYHIPQVMLHERNLVALKWQHS